MLQIDKNILFDKIYGCWYGKCLGGAAGAPFEGTKKLIEIKDFAEHLNSELPNDDLDIQLLWLDVIEKKGFNINACDLADAWIEKCWYPFSEYGYFMKNYMRGIKPPYSGLINNSFFKEGMGCPIRSEIWALICAGNPDLAVKYAYIDGCLDHADNSIYAEQFLAAVESMAFESDDIRNLIVEGMKYIPSDSKLYKCFSYVFELEREGYSWIDVRQKVLNKFGHPDFSNVVQNLAIIIIALIYGKGDMRETINIALKCGYDTDCTCASAASIVGIVKGYSGLGDLQDLIQDRFVCGIDVKRPSDSIKRLAEDTMKITLSMHDAECINLNIEHITESKLEEVKKLIEPVKWRIYGPFYDQLDLPIDTRYPSPHGEGSVLPDLVCMVNNEVFLNRDYPCNDVEYIIDAYEDLIEIDDYITMEGQYACYAEATVISDKDQKVWAVIGNNDGFVLRNNGKEILRKDEIRLWTPYNNFCLLDLKTGSNKINIKLLKRTDKLKFSIGFRMHNGDHWHKSKWCTDLKYV